MKLKLDVEPKIALGSEKEQTWYFLGYDDEHSNYRYRWVIVRRYMACGDVWWGVRPLCDTHENGINDIRKELKIAEKAIEYLKKNWKKHLSIIN